jgi:signal transduction histidine kinase
MATRCACSRAPAHRARGERSRLVNDVRPSRIVTGKLRLTMDACVIDGVVEDALETVRPAADAKSVAIRVQMVRGLKVVADRDRIQQVVWNLLSNAIKFTASGGTVTVSVRRNGQGVEIVVADTGIGIARKDLPYVFQRFWQAHTGASREYSGLGIGLALARHLVELHGGSIAVESEGPGKGATFSVTLPAAAESKQSLRAIR